jgi:tRNA pseudouridine13 synthase
MRWLKGTGVGGYIRASEDFVVREIIHPKFVKKYKIGKKVKEMDGPYTLLKLMKREMTTEQAIKLISEKTGIDKKKFGYAGLKDKFAITTQYLTVKNNITDLFLQGLKLEAVGKTEKHISKGDLLGNEFEITLHDCKEPDNINELTKELRKRGMPNYFGPQRFSGMNEKIGRTIIKTKSSKFPKERAKFLIHAYQSWIFNSMLDMYIKKNSKPNYNETIIVGYKSKIDRGVFGSIIKSLLKKENIRTVDFRIDNLKITCNGGRRKAFIKIPDIKYEIKGSILKLNFSLPKGSYATVLIDEVT